MFKHLISRFRRPSKWRLREELDRANSECVSLAAELEAWKKSVNSLRGSCCRSLIREKKLHGMIYAYDGAVRDAIKAIRQTAPKVSESLKVTRHEFFNDLKGLQERG